jgi:hypothetical protein
MWKQILSPLKSRSSRQAIAGVLVSFLSAALGVWIGPENIPTATLTAIVLGILGVTATKIHKTGVEDAAQINAGTHRSQSVEALTKVIEAKKVEQNGGGT